LFRKVSNASIGYLITPPSFKKGGPLPKALLLASVLVVISKMSAAYWADKVKW
jgi:hypothetical protein